MIPLVFRLSTHCRDGQFQCVSLNHGYLVSQLRDSRGHHHKKSCRVTGLRAGLIGNHNMIIPRIRLLEFGKMQGALRASLDQVVPLIPFIIDRFGARRNDFKRMGFPQAGASPGWLRNNPRRQVHGQRDNTRLHLAKGIAHRHSIIGGVRGGRLGEGQRRIGCPCNLHVSLAPLIA